MPQDTDNQAFVTEVQAWLGVDVDGWAGPETYAAFDRETGEKESLWPLDNEEALTDFYGKRGSNLVRMLLPYPMRLAWDHSTPITSTLVNARCADSLRRILRGILGHYGSLSEVRAARMDLFGGLFNNRRVRGGSKWSRHAWGVAIDLDSTQNGLRTPWPERATMPVAVIEIFEAEGWKSGARAWGRDAMHFQATQ